MSYYSTFTPVYNRFKDWLRGYTGNTGNNVSDRALDYLNRAQDYLWNYRDWQNLLKRQTLTLDSDRKVTMPSDYGKTHIVFYDTNGDNHPDGYYHENHHLRDHSYYLRDTFDESTGHSFEMEFNGTPPYTPILEYKYKLNDYTGEGTEYNFFPDELLLRTAQKMHLEDSDMVTGQVYSMINNSFLENIRDYTQAHQWVDMEMNWVSLDDFGDMADVEEYNLLEGGDSRLGRSDRYSNDYDDRRRY